MTFDEICAIVPRLIAFKQKCATLPAGVCAVTAWNHGGLRDEFDRLVGYHGTSDALRSEEAYDVAFRAIDSVLPECIRRCPECGGEVPSEQTFTGISDEPLPADLLEPMRAAYPQMRMYPSWTLLVDLLGFKRQVFDAAAAGKSAEHLAEFDRLIREAYAFLRPTHRPWALKFFSDNVLLGYPVRDDGESESGEILRAICDFQLSLVFHGQFARGGLSIGDLYMNEYSANGVALIESHASEDVRDAPPRIALSPSAMGVFAGHARYFGGVQRLHTIPLLEDPTDGRWFVDYLAPIVGVRPYTGFDPAALERHRDMIVTSLDRWEAIPTVRSKYRWLAAYHDTSVARRTDREDLLVRAQDAPQAPHLITDESFQRVVRKIAPDGQHIPPPQLLSRVARVMA